MSARSVVVTRGAFLTTLLDDWLWVLRREGVTIAPADVVTILRAVGLVGWSSPSSVCHAVCSVVATTRESDLEVHASFERFFFGLRRDALEVRLARKGLTTDEIAFVKQWMLERAELGANALLAWTERGATFEWMLLEAGLEGRAEQAKHPMLRGFAVHALARETGLVRATSASRSLVVQFGDVFGEERSREVERVLSSEVEEGMDALRELVDARVARRLALDSGAASDAKLTGLSLADEEKLRAAVRLLAERLRGGVRVARRHGRRGALHGPRTFRAAMRTCGVPFVVVRRRRRMRKTRFLFLCDVSDSVRHASRLLLTFVHYAHDVLDDARSFVFVSDVGEVTSDFEGATLDAAFGAIFAGARISLKSNSNYGRALASFASEVLSVVDRSTTVVILGDGRGNFHGGGHSALAALSARAASVYWICPEPRAAWGVGDSQMASYASAVTAVFEAETASDLERAVRAIV